MSPKFPGVQRFDLLVCMIHNVDAITHGTNVPKTDSPICMVFI